jgi:Protein of unknown function (DUF4232)
MSLLARQRGGVKKRSFELICGVTSALVVAAGALAVPALGSGAATPRCATSNLRLDFVPPVQGATGHRFWNLTLRNVGSTTCHLKGYPGVGLLDSHASPISDNVVRQTGFKQRNVVLHPWQRAWFSFEYAVGAFCPGHSLNAFGIRVFPPNSTSRLVYYSGSFNLCGPSVTHPGVFPVRPSKSPL